jgi:hypothetical protein
MEEDMKNVLMVVFAFASLAGRRANQVSTHEYLGKLVWEDAKAVVEAMPDTVALSLLKTLEPSK